MPTHKALLVAIEPSQNDARLRVAVQGAEAIADVAALHDLIAEQFSGAAPVVGAREEAADEWSAQRAARERAMANADA